MYLLDEQKKEVATMFGLTVTSFLMAFLVCSCTLASPRGTPVYAGLNQIEPSKNHFIVVGDTQRTTFWELFLLRESNNDARRRVATEMARRNPSFVVHLGDITAWGSSGRHWREFDDLNKGLLDSNIPLLPILGNHDLYGDTAASLDNYFGHFPHLQKRRWYSFIWNNVGFIMTDSNLLHLSNAERKEQENWYLQELKRFETDKSVDYVVVSCHEAPFTNSSVVNPSHLTQTYFAHHFICLKKSGVFFSGHNHSYERFEMRGKYFVVSGGGGAPRHKVLTKGRQKRYTDLYPGPELRFFHFCQVTLLNQALSVEIVRLEPDGTFSVADSFRVSGYEKCR